MAEHDPWLRRRPGAGLLLLLFVLAALALPLWYFRGNDHPLAGEESVSLCDRLPGLLLPGLVAVNGKLSGGAGVCIWRDEQGQTPFEATLTTMRNSSPRGVEGKLAAAPCAFVVARTASGRSRTTACCCGCALSA